MANLQFRVTALSFPSTVIVTLDSLESPHAYKEHCICRANKIDIFYLALDYISFEAR